MKIGDISAIVCDVVKAIQPMVAEATTAVALNMFQTLKEELLKEANHAKTHGFNRLQAEVQNKSL